MAETDNSNDAIPEHVRAALQLALTPGVGPRTLQNLLSRFETAEGVLAATADALRSVDGVGPKLTSAILAARNPSAAIAEWNAARKIGVSLFLRGYPEYPAALSRIIDPPGVLYCRGTLQSRDELAVAIVGSRRCTVYGRQQAERLGAALARSGLTIVSGLARGIDAAAHRGALSAGGRTIAVLGTGLDNIYPPEHVDLAKEVAQNGAVLSECSLGAPAIAGMFPQRNRIIAGLSLGVIVVEATRDSGSLHTVRHAMEQNREVFAVPGRVDSLASEGCHNLIRDGVTLIRNADDVLQGLGPLPMPVTTTVAQTVSNPRELTLNDQESRVLNLVSADPLPVDEVLRTANMEPSRVLATLTVLEMKRLVRRLPGGRICRT